ncbi:MAD2L1-binding protein-like [Petromyzon marinus]|uniref:MAD2L1-binding protein-like n=1 Tax=Petromyzon marinus TaxID=7757 RepID=UPI003F715F58
MSARRCEVTVRGAVSQRSLGALVWEIFAHALYQRGQLPLPYPQLLHFHSHLAEVPPRLRQEARMLTALHELSGHLETLFSLSHVPRVLILLGPSPMSPLELYELDFHELALGGSGDSLCHARYSRHVFHSLFVQNVFGEPRALPVTSATLLLWAHRDCGVDWFKPKLNYKPPNRGRRVVVAFSNSLEEPLGTALDQPCEDDCVWFQAPVAIKGVLDSGSGQG